MPKRNERDSDTSNTGVINWDPPKPRELVERALSDGMTDPVEIATWARNYKLTLTVEEVQRLIAELGK